MNGYKWEIAFLKFHVVLRPYGKSAIFFFIYILCILCAFKAIHSTGKIVKKCLQLLTYRQFGYNDKSSSRNKQGIDQIAKNSVCFEHVKLNFSL